MAKKIIRSKETIHVNRGQFANAHEALRSCVGTMTLDHFGLEPAFGEIPASFKLAVRVRFTRTDGKEVSRKILQTVSSWGSGYTEAVPFGPGRYEFDEVYHPGYVAFPA